MRNNAYFSDKCVLSYIHFPFGPLFYQSTSSQPVTEDYKNVNIVKENKVLIIVKN